MASVADLPADVTKSILYLLDDIDLANACLVNKDFSKRICNDTFWLHKIINKYGLTHDEIKRYKKNNTYLAYYLKLNKYILNNEDAPYNILFRGAYNGIADLVIIALRRGANLHSHDEEPLRWATQQGHIEVVRLLLEHGANPHTVSDLPLRYAIKYGYKDIAELLLKNGADPNTNNGEPLRLARYRGHTELIQLLLEYGANQ